MAFAITSTAFGYGKPMPVDYTADGRNFSPPLKWTDPPSQTGSFALIAEDPDAPKETWCHWVAFNIPAESRELAEGLRPEERLPNGMLQGRNDFGRVGYGGPSPPRGKPHRYFFRLFALDRPLDLAARCDRETLLEAMNGSILAAVELMGTYGRT